MTEQGLEYWFYAAGEQNYCSCYICPELLNGRRGMSSLDALLQISISLIVLLKVIECFETGHSVHNQCRESVFV